MENEEKVTIEISRRDLALAMHALMHVNYCGEIYNPKARERYEEAHRNIIAESLKIQGFSLNRAWDGD